MSVKSVLSIPNVYQLFQRAFGFFNARTYAVQDFLHVASGMRVLDVGCGPGFLARHLPKGVIYTGFDIDQRYIDFANDQFSDYGDFQCRVFDDAAAEEFAGADLVMLNGVLHHLPDEVAVPLLGSIAKVLSPSGKLFTLDGCYRNGQNSIAKRLLDNDRGEYVRDQPGYVDLVGQSFPNIRVSLEEQLSWVPYTFLLLEASTSMDVHSSPSDCGEK